MATHKPVAPGRSPSRRDAPAPSRVTRDLRTRAQALLHEERARPPLSQQRSVAETVWGGGGVTLSPASHRRGVDFSGSASGDVSHMLTRDRAKKLASEPQLVSGKRGPQKARPKVARNKQAEREPKAQAWNERIAHFLALRDAERTPAAIDAAHRLMVKCQFFQKYDEHQQKQLVQIARHHRVGNHQTVFKQDDSPDAVYLIIKGRCAIYKSQGEMRKLLTHHGVFDTVGGIYHLDERLRRSVTAEVNNERTERPLESLDSHDDAAEFIMFEREPLDALTAKWKAQEEYNKATFLSTEIPVLKCVHPSVIPGLSPHFEKVLVPKDTVIYRQQDEATCLYFVWEGELQIVRRCDLLQATNSTAETSSPLKGALGSSIAGPDIEDRQPRRLSKSLQLAVLRKGEFFGEVEMFNDIPRTSTVVATTACTLLVVQKQTLSGDVFPAILLENLFRYAAMRAQARNERVVLILGSFGVGALQWQLERDVKQTLEPDLKPLARMRASLIPMSSDPSRTWLGVHTNVPPDAREWGLYNYGQWAQGGRHSPTQQKQMKSERERIGTAANFDTAPSDCEDERSVSPGGPTHTVSDEESPNSATRSRTASTGIVKTARTGSPEKIIFFNKIAGGQTCEKWE